MGFYIRKSIFAGPFRFNLSTSGVGVSVGVKGFRVGTGPRRNYVHMAGADCIIVRRSDALIKQLLQKAQQTIRTFRDSLTYLPDRSPLSRLDTGKTNVGEAS
jgi:hypothetical protein